MSAVNGNAGEPTANSLPMAEVWMVFDGFTNIGAVFIIFIGTVTCVVLATINSQSLHVEEEEGGGIILRAVEPHLVTEFQVAVALSIATAAVLVDADALIFMLRVTVLLRSTLARTLVLVKVRLINSDGGRSA